MDPNAALKACHKAIAEWRDADTIDSQIHALEDLLTHFQGLDDWLKRGGFLPRDWQRKP